MIFSPPMQVWHTLCKIIKSVSLVDNNRVQKMPVSQGPAFLGPFSFPKHFAAGWTWPFSGSEGQELPGDGLK